MSLKPANPPLGAAVGLYRSSSSIGVGDGSKSKSPQPKNQAACPIIIASRCRMVADLLAESVEITIGYSVNILSAIRLVDDDAALSQFKGFDAATRTARQCAEELRALRHLP